MTKDYKAVQAEYRKKAKATRVIVQGKGITLNLGIQKFKKAYPGNSKAIKQYKTNAWTPGKEDKK